MTISTKAEVRYEAAADEEMLFGVVAAELARNQVSSGLYAKALAEADGNEQKARARYIKLRVEILGAERAARHERACNDQARANAAAQQAERLAAPSLGKVLAGAARGFREGLNESCEAEKKAEEERRRVIEALPLEKKGRIALLTISVATTAAFIQAYSYQPSSTLFFGFGHGWDLTWLVWAMFAGCFFYWVDIVRLYIKLKRKNRP